MFTALKNAFWNLNRYREHPEALIVSCFFNPQNSEYRLKAFNRWYDSIKHMNHIVMECVIGDAKPQLPESKNIKRIYTENLLWHKESLINLAVKESDPKYKYIFWVDADVIFTNLDWLTESVKEMQYGAKILQPFEYCIHLNKDETSPNFNVNDKRDFCTFAELRHKEMWRSACANYVDNKRANNSTNYDVHGHVGFAWGAKREVFDKIGLYDRALIGGADHIIFHAAEGRIPCECINKSFTDDLAAVYCWSKEFNKVVTGDIGYVKGDLYHLWHGDIDKRQYLKRIQEFTPTTKKITEKDENGLYVTKKGDDEYIKRYFAHREVPNKTTVINKHYHNTNDSSRPHNDGFMDSMMMGYMTDSSLIGTLHGGNPVGAMLGASMRNNERSPTVHTVQEVGRPTIVHHEPIQPTRHIDASTYDYDREITSQSTNFS